MRPLDDTGTLSERIAYKIKKKIISGEWYVGQKLANEQDLAAEMNVSRTTIREAVKILVSIHVLRIERGKGTFVLNTPGVSEDPLGLDFVDPDTLIRDMCEYRLLLEPSACALAAQRASGDELDAMEVLTASMESVTAQVRSTDENSNLLDELAELEAQYHALIYKMTNNVLFQRMSHVMNNTVFETYMSSFYRRGIVSHRLLCADVHIELYNAIRARDPEKAREVSKEHMKIMYDELVGIRSDPPSGPVLCGDCRDRADHM